MKTPNFLNKKLLQTKTKEIMRELKFRVWDKNIPTIEEVELGIEENGIEPSGKMLNWDYVKESDYLRTGLKGYYPIMQYTGLKDKNGVEIYEGDLVACFHKEQIKDGQIIHNPTYEIYQIQFLNGGFVVDEDDDILLGQWIYNCSPEIIGNIHENPELLK